MAEESTPRLDEAIITFASKVPGTYTPPSNVPSPLLSWHIRCVNSETQRFFDRRVILDTRSLTEAQRGVLLYLVDARDRRLCRFRELFREAGEDVDRGDWHQQFDSFHSFSLEDYFENENGTPMDMVGLAELLTGKKDLVIAGDVGSVLRIGPVGMRSLDRWSTRKANGIAHFLRLIESIQSSNWFRGKLEVSYSTRPGNNQRPSHDKFLDWQHPEAVDVRSVLIPLRQLYSNTDNSLNFACKGYLDHVDHDQKQLWVKQEKSHFNSALRGTPLMLPLEAKSVQQILNLIIYGLGEVHRESDDKSEEDLRIAVSRCGKESVMAAFSFAAKAILIPAIKIYYVIKQDFDHWLQLEGVARPDVLTLEDLRGSR